MIQGRGIVMGKALTYVTIAISVAAALQYFVLHWTLLFDPMPLAMREAAPILIGEAYAEQLKDGDLFPYAEEQYPESTSVYGPVYSMLTGSLQALLDQNPYTIHRVAVALAIVLAALFCGWLVWRRSNFHMGLLAAVWFYLLQVASLTVTAGPSALCVLFYVIGIAAILHFGPGRLGLFLAIAAGFLGLLTKPYASLVIPAALIYVYLFHSPRRALVAACITAGATAVLLQGASILMPTYFHSVYVIHSAYATRIFENLLSQSVVFSKLNFGLILALLAAFPCTGYAVRKLSFRSLWGREPLVRPDIGFDRLMVLVAAAALLFSLGWHGGAYLIYFNHLLLPPLLIAALGCPIQTVRAPSIIQGVLLLNLALLMFWRPPLRADSDAHKEVLSLLLGKTALVDPVFEPYARIFRKVELIDNGQTEYLVYYDQHHESPLSQQSKEWEQALDARLKSGEIEVLCLAPQFSRSALLHKGAISETLNANYKLTHTIGMPIYFYGFKDWSLFGNGQAEIYLFQKKSTVQATPIKNEPAAANRY